MTTSIEVDSYRLIFGEPDESGARIVALYCVATGELREQTLYEDEMPSGKRWRATVAGRMAVRKMTYETPRTLLHGVK